MSVFEMRLRTIQSALDLLPAGCRFGHETLTPVSCEGCAPAQKRRDAEEAVASIRHAADAAELHGRSLG